MKRLAGLIILLLMPLGASAAGTDQFGLQIAPLKYETSFEGPTPKIGYIDVANPSADSVRVVASIQGFRQSNNSGDLEFFDDPVLAGAITLASSDFVVTPRGAVRVPFSVDPTKLPDGGNYGAIFFQTQNGAKLPKGNVLVPSARVGTLLLLNNHGGKKAGRINKLTVPFWQFGNTISGHLSYQNTGKNGFLAFNPTLEISLLPGMRHQYITGPLIFPSRERSVEFGRSGSYLGLLPVTVTAKEGGRQTRWVFAITGFWRWGLPLVLLFLFGIWWWKKRQPKYLAPEISKTIFMAEPESKPKVEVPSIPEKTIPKPKKRMLGQSPQKTKNKRSSRLTSDK